MGDFEVAYHALTAEEGIDKYAEIKPDLVTMDIILPGMSGIDAIKTIKDKDARANIIVISSVGGGQEKLFEAIQAGAKNVIVKPFEEERVKEIFYQSV
jgi:two-component system chemotaxis response regulator CheY